MGPRPKVKGACGFCHRREQNNKSGKLYKTPDDEVAAHFNCMLFSPTLVTMSTQDEEDDDDSFGGFLLDDVKKEIKRGRRLKCFVCKQSGATIGCDVKKCKKSFHYLCAVESGTNVIDDKDKEVYKIYCERHKHKRTSNGEEDNEDSNGPNVSTDDDQMDEIPDASDDTFDGDTENDLSFGPNKGKEKREGKKAREKMEMFEYLKLTRNEVENTPKKSMLKRAKTSTPHGPSANVTNSGRSNLDVSGTNAVASPASVLGAKSKSQDGSKMVTWETSLSKKRRRLIADSDSSESSTSINTPIPAEIVHEGPNAENQRAENSNPQWIELLSGYHARVIEHSRIDGQNNTMRPRDFWQLCKVLKCTEALFEKMNAALQSRMQRIQSQTASEDDYVKVFDVLRTTECLQTIAKELQQEIQDQKEALEKEKADLSKREQKLNEIIPALDRASTREVSSQTAENKILEFK